MNFSTSLRKNLLVCAGLALVLSTFASASNAERVRDFAHVEGVRQNQLVGYGLVVGLDGTGDQTAQTPFAVQSTIAMLSKLGVTLPAGTQLQLKNLATVIVTTQMPPFAKIGQQIDITVSSLGNAKSLKGGTLIATQLKGLDGNTYAIAQGNVVVGGFSASAAPAAPAAGGAAGAAGGASTQSGHMNVGRIPSGASIERSVETVIGTEGHIRLELKTADFGMASNLADAINAVYPNAAEAIDARSIEVAAPKRVHDRVAFIGKLEAIELASSKNSARVTINARTGSVVVNENVTIDECAVAHGSLTVQIGTEVSVSQPSALSGGQTVVTSRSTVDVKSGPGQLVRLPKSSSLMDVVRALNAIGATSQDLVSILQALKSAGSLRAEIDII